MPPNPTEYNPGFLTWLPTDGKIHPAVIGGDSHPIAACMIAPEPVRKAQEAIMAAKPAPAPAAKPAQKTTVLAGKV
jgi:hypothetical protein